MLHGFDPSGTRDSSISPSGVGHASPWEMRRHLVGDARSVAAGRAAPRGFRLLCNGAAPLCSRDPAGVWDCIIPHYTLAQRSLATSLFPRGPCHRIRGQKGRPPPIPARRRGRAASRQVCLGTLHTVDAAEACRPARLSPAWPWLETRPYNLAGAGQGQPKVSPLPRVAGAPWMAARDYRQDRPVGTPRTECPARPVPAR